MKEELTILCFATAAFVGGCGEDFGVPVVDPVTEQPSFAVVSSDFSSSSVSLLNTQGEVIADDWFHSGVAISDTATALSGDVGLPTVQMSDDTITLIDRGGFNVLTQLRPRHGTVSGQLRTQVDAYDAEDPVSLDSNPQDVLFLSAHSAWISRFGVQSHATNPEGIGDDLLEFDPSTLELTGRRIDFSFMYGTEPVSTPGSEEEVDTFARPTRIARLGNFAAVATMRGSEDLFTSPAVASGQLAIVDLTELTVEAVDLGDFLNCAELSPVPSDEEHVVIGCGGWPFGDPSTSGIVLVSVDEEGHAQVQSSYSPSMIEGALLAVNSVVAINSNEVLAVSFGAFEFDESFNIIGGTGDTLVRIDLSAEQETIIAESAGPYELGQPAFDRDQSLLVVPDAVQTVPWEAVANDTDRIRRFSIGNEIVELDPVVVSTELGLSPRSVHKL